MDISDLYAPVLIGESTCRHIKKEIALAIASGIHGSIASVFTSIYGEKHSNMSLSGGQQHSLTLTT